MMQDKASAMAESKCVGCEPELRVDLAAYGDRVTPGRANQITLARVNTPTRNILRKFDNNGDGRIDATEIQTIVTTLVAEKFKSKAFKIGLIILAVFTTVLLGAMFGLTWAVVAALKDTKVQGGILVTNDKQEAPVLVANLDLTVSGTKLVARNSSEVVATSTVRTPGYVTTGTPFDKLLALQNLVLITPGNSSLSLAILGVARIPSNSSGGYVVKVLTAAGTLTLKNGEWSAPSNVTGTLLEDVFVQPAGQGRRLSEQNATATFYVICEGGECGDPIPCGQADSAPCPTSNSSTSNRVPVDLNGLDLTEGNTGTYSCSLLTGFVNYCSAGLTDCYGPSPTSTQKSRYFSQYGCTSNCGTWVYDPVYGDCGGSPSKRFCCP
ncbi:hypothetical protein Vretimale_10833 [Volvox reticuliferus]|uniref:EF-hand domain-containing protein n=1 Tax=Volvox reticuliferus TaxID=1737510 RepID=A0A8J4GG59_9CHLO|nr:hypothetical protein Vretifemale_13568 [Volvox reticuliferus]GIM06537.1 hypothetical protein Vretimale_10833 [Volvox reticuliferus]